jgi:hypothetical protein
MAVVVVTVAVEVVLVAAPSRVVLTTTVAPGLSAKSAAKSATPSSNAGTGWMIRTKKKDRRWPWDLQTRTRWIPIGTVIPAPRTTSRAIFIALPCVSNVTEATRCKLAMEQVCKFCILVLVQLILILAPLPSIMSFMFLIYSNIFFRFINYLVIITCFFEFHPWYYFIKGRAARKLLLEGKCENGLYPLKPSDVESLHQAFVGYSTQPDQWHARFGHPSSHIVRSILRLNNLPCLKESSVSSVCNACQLAKSHQLPYNTSIHCTTMPLEIIHSDVWGPTPISVGGYKYYISFIDDFMKFTWIYLMVDRTEAQHIFLQFQKHVERLLDNKIRCVQFDWGEEYQKLHNQFFTSLDIVHRVSCSHTHQ